MPCDCSYMEPHNDEVESHDTAQRLRYALLSLGQKVPDWLQKAATDMYGDRRRLKNMVVTLCTLVGSMTDEQKNSILYDGRNPKARLLAIWWERHEAADQERIEREKDTVKLSKARNTAIAKLSQTDIKALGL
ncbi:hypothetical protein LCGC14_0410870 [marine sediment metagenome]|uniref:Uncharacterized protein n=1 Tax=marine sediment metagenome TaxID=412755 RepID=A0A0F9VFN6_9ZZZZ